MIKPLHHPTLRLSAAVLLACTTLTACAPLLLGAAAGGTALMATDRRTSGSQVEDSSIDLKVSSKVREALHDKGHVNVTAYNGMVLLTGEVPAEADKQTAAATAARIEHVTNVVNELAVTMNSSLSGRSNDLLIEGKVKATYLDARDVMSNAIKVTVERSEVYLMGIVTEREATRAAELAAGIPGVRKVVKTFQIVTEAELANRVQPHPPRITDAVSTPPQ